jgi:hypothetical protein
MIASGSLRELGLDRLLAFQHDVLREWGVAARLHDVPDRIGQLPLSRPLPASLARGVELGARFALERSEDGQTWVNYLNGVSTSGSHASWRRWSLLAILRSELVFTLLDRASALLFENDGTLLRELIRTAIAVESRPLVETLAERGVDVGAIPAGIYGPSNGSWARLARWLLARRVNLPLRALPDVVELFQNLSPATRRNAVSRTAGPDCPNFSNWRRRSRSRFHDGFSAIAGPTVGNDHFGQSAARFRMGDSHSKNAGKSGPQIPCITYNFRTNRLDGRRYAYCQMGA